MNTAAWGIATSTKQSGHISGAKASRTAQPVDQQNQLKMLTEQQKTLIKVAK